LAKNKESRKHLLIGVLIMSTNVHAFKETDLKRAIRSARAAGLDITAVVVTKDGTIDLRTAKAREPELVVNTAKNAADVVADRLG
jgi:hypothetical protein